MSGREMSAPRPSVTDPFHPVHSIHKLLQWQLHTENIFIFLYVAPESFLIRAPVKIHSGYATTAPTNLRQKNLKGKLLEN